MSIDEHKVKLETPEPITWPVALDNGVEDYTIWSEYCQPPVRGNTVLSFGSVETDRENPQPSPTSPVNTESASGGIQIEENIVHESDDESDSGSNSEDDYISFEESDVPRIYRVPNIGSPDLMIVLEADGQVKHEFIVSSHFLSLASTDWREMLDPGNPKSVEKDQFDGTEIKVLRFKNDDPRVLWLVLKVIHRDCEDVPKSLPYDFLRKIAVLCDKYKCGNALHQLGPTWLKKYENQAVNFQVGYEDWMFIAKALEPKMTMMKKKEISRKLASELSSRSYCQNYFWRQIEDVTKNTEVESKFIDISDDVSSYMVNERSRAIDEIVVLLRQFVSDINTQKWSEPIPRHICVDQSCLDLATGSLMRELKRLHLWPLVRSQKPYTWHASVSVLVSRIKRINMSTLMHKKDNLRSQSPPIDHTIEYFDEKQTPVNSQQARLLDARDNIWAWRVEKLRFNSPAFEEKSFPNAYYPCSSAFLLGDLISKTQAILVGILEGGYEDAKRPKSKSKTKKNA